jgi:hypothetical protein
MTIPSLDRTSRRLAIEAVAVGLAYGGGLCWASTCLVASFRLQLLADPYWSAVPGLRTDTCGALAFVVAAIGLAVSEYLRLRRRQDGGGTLSQHAQLRSAPRLAATAGAETVAALSTGLVAYLSVNAVTHPYTLAVQATHFASWPTEGTLRVLALFGCVASLALMRYLRAGRPHHGGPGMPLVAASKGAGKYDASPEPQHR